MKHPALYFLFSILLSCSSLAQDFTSVRFEEPKDTAAFEKVSLSFALDLSFYFQGLGHTFEPTEVNTTKQDIQPGLILPTADLRINAKVMKGFNVKIEAMLSSHHHNETYLKGGYASIDNLDFIHPGFAKDFMSNATFKIGVNEINFGDAHFRRTDNASVFKNPFILNMAVESYMQAGFIELFYRMPSISSFIMIGTSNGQVNPDDVKASEGSSAYSSYTKLGFDKQFSDENRFRISESIFHVQGTSKTSLYNGDKAGNVAREIFNNTTTTKGNDYVTTWKAIPSYKDLTVSMTNVFAQYHDLEFFGLFETADGKDSSNKSLKLTHYSLELIQRFGDRKRFYIAGRYEKAETQLETDTSNDRLTQIQASLGWYLSKHALTKIEHVRQVRQEFEEFTQGEGSFEGFMISASLSF